MDRLLSVKTSSQLVEESKESEEETENSVINVTTDYEDVENPKVIEEKEED